jgi:DNA-binding MarR family transcriptional regulator
MATSDSADQPAVVEQDGLVDALVQTSFVTMALLTKLGAEHDLSLTQLRVLAILRDRRLKMTELADYLGLDKSTMTGLVDRAERRGLLERVRNPTDGRVVDVRISHAGAELGDHLYARVARSLAPMTGTLTHADQRRLRTLLEKVLHRN